MNTEKQYIQAYNKGYVLARHEPDFSNTLFQELTPSNNYLQGLLAGRQQLELENSKHQLFQLQQLRRQSSNREKDFEK